MEAISFEAYHKCVGKVVIHRRLNVYILFLKSTVHTEPYSPFLFPSHTFIVLITLTIASVRAKLYKDLHFRDAESEPTTLFHTSD